MPQNHEKRKKHILEKYEQVLAGIQKKIHRINQIFVIVILAAMVGIVGASVFMRYVLNCGFTWSEDIVTLLFSYLIFFSIPLAFRAGSHIRIELFLLKSTERTRGVFNLVVDGIILITLILLFSMSLDAVHHIGDSPYGGLMFPMSFFYYAVTSSTVVMFIDISYMIVRHLNEIIRQKRRA
ncbi:MAG: TRAP transporter small permease [Deltaproteobacteria bacterium]|nr:TRAP transporter small permease [Deltaproteobacteria bacterium]